MQAHTAHSHTFQSSRPARPVPCTVRSLKAIASLCAAPGCQQSTAPVALPGLGDARPAFSGDAGALPTQSCCSVTSIRSADGRPQVTPKLPREAGRARWAGQCAHACMHAGWMPC
eukprot:241699-Chlamydomonas_euryale.AAC.8